MKGGDDAGIRGALVLPLSSLSFPSPSPVPDPLIPDKVRGQENLGNFVTTNIWVHILL